MMSKLRFGLIAAAALVLPLLAVEKSSAQFGFGYGRFGRYSGVGVSVGTPYYGYGYSPYYGGYYGGYAYSPWYGSGYYSPGYGSGYYTSPTYTYYSTPTYSYPMTYSSAYVTSAGTSGSSASGTTSTQAFYPPNAQGNMPAIIDVQVPADAQITFDGESTNQTGMQRIFRSPALEPGQNYSYEVTARWNESGKDIERTRKVRVRAGERVSVNFMANEEEGVGTPRPSGTNQGTPQPRPEDKETSPRPGTDGGTGNPPRPGPTGEGSTRPPQL
jgi:uncharacterized protein (TIGR03000 family)